MIWAVASVHDNMYFNNISGFIKTTVHVILGCSTKLNHVNDQEKNQIATYMYAYENFSLCPAGLDNNNTEEQCTVVSLSVATLNKGHPSNVAKKSMPLPHPINAFISPSHQRAPL